MCAPFLFANDEREGVCSLYFSIKGHHLLSKSNDGIERHVLIRLTSERAEEGGMDIIKKLCLDQLCVDDTVEKLRFDKGNISEEWRRRQESHQLMMY